MGAADQSGGGLVQYKGDAVWKPDRTPLFGRFIASAMSWQSIQRFTQRLGHRRADLKSTRTEVGLNRVLGVEAVLPATDATHTRSASFRYHSIEIALYKEASEATAESS